MSATEALVAVFALALILIAPALFRSWLNARLKEKHMANRLEMARLETERMRLMTEAMRQHATRG